MALSLPTWAARLALALAPCAALAALPMVAAQPEPALEPSAYLSPVLLGSRADPSPPPTAAPSPSPEPTPNPAPAPETISWEKRAAPPLGLYEAQGLAEGSALYVFGGYYNSAIQATQLSYAYDVALDRWRRLADMPEALTHAGAASDGTRIFLAGGFQGDSPGPATSHVWIYSIADDRWTAGPPLPGPRAGGGLALLGRTLHFFGGVSRQSGIGSEVDHADHWALDLDAGGGWQARAPLPNPRNHMAGVALGGRAYALGGQHLGDEVNANQTAVDVYDPVTDTWGQAAPLPLPLGHIQCSVVALDGRLVVGSGITTGKVTVPDVSLYDPAADGWSALTPLPRGFQSPVMGVIGGRLVLSGAGETWVGTPQ